MPFCLSCGSLVSGPGRKTCGLVLLAFSLFFAEVPVRAQDQPGRSKPSQQPPGGEPGHSLFGDLGLPDEKEIPPDPGMTLDQAIERMLRENLGLRAARDEIDMADADIEAAGQPPRASLFINVEFDGIRARTARAHEVLPRRWFDTLVAREARRVIAALYQDAVRLQHDKLYEAFVDVQEAENRVRFAETRLRGLGQLLKLTEELHHRGQIAASEVTQLRVARERATVALGDSEANLKKTRLVLGNLLNLPDADVERLRLRSDLEQFTDPGREPPATEELVRRALQHRPDLRAYRLGVARAQADWLKAMVEPLCQMTFSPWLDRRDPPGARQVAIAPAPGLGVVITLPATVRNRGVLKRAEINVRQTRTQLAKLERDVILDVRKARSEYDQARAAVVRYRKEIIPAAHEQRDHRFRLYLAGEASMADYSEGMNQYNERVKEYLDLTIRLRRGTLAINTAVGERILR